MFTLGIDVAKETLHLHLISESYRCSHKCANSPAAFPLLREWLERRGVSLSDLEVCLEATGGYEEAVAADLYDHGCVVYVVNPYRVKRWAESELLRTKTDAVDAKLLAHYIQQAVKKHPWLPVAPEYRELQRLARLRNELVNDRTAWSNRAGAPGQPTSVITVCQQVIATLEAQLLQVDQEVQSLLQTHATLAEDVALADSIIGFGAETAVLLIGEFGNGSQFAKTSQGVASAGLSVTHHDSGTTVHGKPRISKHGNARVRKGLYYPAITAMTHDPHLAAFAQRLLANGKRKRQVICAVMRKLLERFFAVLRTRRPYEKEYQGTPVS